MGSSSLHPSSHSYKVSTGLVTTLSPMGGKRNLIATLCALALWLSLGCAPISASTQSVSDHSNTHTPTRAQRIAQTLADAEMASDQDQKARLGELVNVLIASGVSPHDEQSTDLVNQWRQTASGNAPAYRGRLLGPAYVRGTLAPGETWSSAQTFKSGEPSTLAVSHKGSGPISLSVSDQSARTVCTADERASPACRFTPLYTQRYSITLVNEGPENAVYYLIFD